MARMPRSPTLLALAIVLLVLARPQVLFAQGLVVSFAPDSPMYQRIEPAQSGTLAFEIRNSGPVEAQGSVGGFIDVPVDVVAQYTVVPADPVACPAPTLAPMLGSHALIFPHPRVAAGGTVTCRYSVRRGAGSRDDLGFQVCAFRNMPVIGCGQSVRRGTLPDLSLAVVVIGPIAGEPGAQLLRLDMRNPSKVDVESRIASTACHEFGGGGFAPTAFDVDGAFAGGCPRAGGQGCINFTGQLFDSRAFELGPVAAGATASCLVRVRPRGGGTTQVPLALFGDRVVLAGGAVAFDPERVGERGVIGLGLGAAEPVPLDRRSGVLFALLVLATGLLALETRLRRAQV